ncbi:hypothetical protein GCM10010363_29900 [Streptomyces omiyaensis]|nr:hypothetical protein GCM10010363_29900 [Streptomyces omiyaensis]
MDDPADGEGDGDELHGGARAGEEGVAGAPEPGDGDHRGGEREQERQEDDEGHVHLEKHAAPLCRSRPLAGGPIIPGPPVKREETRTRESADGPHAAARRGAATPP